MADITIREQREKMIVKANALIEKSRFELSIQQQKIILYLISKISRQDTEFSLYEFSIQEFCKVCGINAAGENYNILKAQIKAIADKSVWVRLDNGKETLLRWIEKPYINEQSGIIQIKLDEDLKPYLLQLTQNFTEYELIYALGFKSKYTIRLYEYIKSIHYRELQPYSKTISIEEFKERLNATKYNEFKSFNLRVLKPAVAEINEISDKIITYELIKSGRKVKAIKIQIDSKDVWDRFKAAVEIEKGLDKE